MILITIIAYFFQKYYNVNLMLRLNEAVMFRSFCVRTTLGQQYTDIL